MAPAQNPDPELGLAIADQGNRALLEIRAESRQALQEMKPVLPEYAVQARESVTVAVRETGRL